MRIGRHSCWFAATVLAISGCAQFWEDATSVSPEGGFRANMTHRWNLLFSRPDPLEVLAKSHDNDYRARALRNLTEPADHGGNQQDQEFVLSLLHEAAKSEKQTICRLAAVETLGRFKDPRATQALVAAYEAPANREAKSQVVRMAVVQSLTARRDPRGTETLVAAMTGDPSMDVRIVAAKGLGQFKNDEATQALASVLRKEKDIALRDQARESLELIAGRDFAEAERNVITGKTSARQAAKDMVENMENGAAFKALRQENSPNNAQPADQQTSEEPEKPNLAPTTFSDDR